MRSFVAAVVPSFLLGQYAPCQTTWTVPANAPTVRAAVQRAAPGDTVTMLPGAADLVGNVVVDKAITLVNCTIVFPDRSFGILVTGMAGGDRLALRNVTVVHSGDGFTQSASDIESLRIELPAASRGTLVLDHVLTAGAKGGSGSREAHAGLRVVSLGGAEVLARGCTFAGASGYVPFLAAGDIGPEGGHGAVLAPGRYLFEDCVMLGGQGGDAWWDPMMVFPARDGAAGLLAPQHDAVLVGCVVVDGNGGAAMGPTLYPPNDPCAMAAQPGQSALPADLFSLWLQPGRAGTVEGCGTAPPLPPPQTLGAPVDLVFPAAIATAGLPVPVRAASLGPAQGFSALLAGFPLRRSLLPGTLGALWIDQIVWAGLLPPPDGTGWCTMLLPAVPAVLGAPIDVRLQIVHVTTSLGVAFGAPRALTVVP